VGEPGQLVDQGLQVVAEIAGRNTPRELSLVADRELGEYPGQLTRRQSAVLALTRGERVGERQPKLVQGSNVDEVPDLRAPEQGAELVREDLFSGIHANPTVGGLLGPDLLGVLDHEVDDDGLVPFREQDPAELGSRANFLPRCPDVCRRLAESSDSIVHDRSQGEQVEVVGLPVTEVIAGEGPSAGQVEAALESEERLEEMCLK